MKFILAILGVLVINQTSFAAHSVPVVVQEGNHKFKGDLYVPEKAQNKKEAIPLVVVVHEWWGKTDYPAKRGKQIADELGYAALVVDLYGDGKTTDSAKEAQALAGPFYQNPSQGVKRLEAFMKAIPGAADRARVNIDTAKMAAIGYCFGGTQVLNLARTNSTQPIGVVSFHGGLSSSLKAKSPLHSKVLILHGADDTFIKPEEIEAFKKEMKDAHADLHFVSYPGAVHAFSNPKATEMGKKNNIPVAYNEEADKGSWKEMASFLKKLFE